MLAAAIATISLSAGVALAGGGGTPVGGGGGGGETVVRDAICKERCLDVRTVAVTGKIEMLGRGLEDTESVRLHGDDGSKLLVTPRRVSEQSVIAVVPEGAASGKPSVISTAGVRTAAPVEIKVKPEDAIADVEGFSVKRVEPTPVKAYFNGKRSSSVDYLFEADGPADVRIDVIAKKSGKVVDSEVQPDREPFTSQAFEWDGLNDARKVPRSGKYRYRISDLGSGEGEGAGFGYYDHKFPLRGKHSYGEGLGAGRGHQGQDVLGGCGKKILAARGGRITTSAYQSAAGYYLVVDGRKTSKDYAYMHMQRRARAKEGERVKTGELIGYASDTGNATACMLHFELWSGPGWYEGGHPIDPTRPLKKWDGWS